MVLYPGFWRESSTSEKILSCEFGHCLSNGVCELGYSGPLCEECDNRNEFVKESINSCKKCN